MQAYIEKEDSKKLKQKQRERMQPKMGKMDIDYQVLHDAFFKYQTKPKLTTHGDLYHEGKEFEVKLREMNMDALCMEMFLEFINKNSPTMRKIRLIRQSTGVTWRKKKRRKKKKRKKRLRGALVCSGSLHPDSLIRQEQHAKADKKAYYSEINKYHNDMIKYLQKLKETWESSKDPEKDILQKISRSTRNADRQISSYANESGCHIPEENIAATSESCSFVAEEKACSSDNQISPITENG